MENIIPFPIENSRAHLLMPVRAAHQEEQIFTIGNKVEFVSDGQQGVITDGQASFGRQNRWLYWVLILDGKDKGTTRAAHGNRLIKLGSAT